MFTDFAIFVPKLSCEIVGYDIHIIKHNIDLSFLVSTVIVADPVQFPL